MTISPSNTKPLLTPRKIVVQVVGWLLGLALLGLVIKGAMVTGSQTGGGDGPSAWDRIRSAHPLLIAALLGCTVCDALLNGSTFWITVQPLRRVRWRDLQMVNIVANMLNYAPVRLGAIFRVLYHLRIDGLSIIQIGGWFALISYMLFACAFAFTLATLIRGRIDFIWLALVVGQLILAGASSRLVASIPMVARRARGLDQMVLDRRGLWGGFGLRALDLATYIGRMASAMAILDLHLAPSQIVMLAMIVLIASLSPIGKVGVREFCVAAAVTHLGMNATANDAAQLALLESAGEALVYLPLGVIAMPWLYGKWRIIRQTNATAT